MITVIVDRTSEDRSIRGIYVSGHSGYDRSGRDIVCAGISTLCYAAANALEDICGYETDKTAVIRESEDDEVFFRLSVPDIGTEEQRKNAQVVMRTTELGMMNVAQSVNGERGRYVEIIHSR